uniref:Uncharacterized protein n=1 Tax=Cynoglossus semilaevis TaxID=244447 RepID=A0A3P8V9U9_CYNSE
MLSFSLSPVFPVFKMRSDPARSTKRDSPRRWSMYTVKIVCDRLEFGFIWVAPVCRAVFPDSSKLKTSSRPSTSHSLTPNKTTKSQKRQNDTKN